MNKKEERKINGGYNKRLRKAAKVSFVRGGNIETAKAALAELSAQGKLNGKGAQSVLIDTCVRHGLSIEDTAGLLVSVLGYERNAFVRVLAHKTSKMNTPSRMLYRNKHI